MRLRLVLVGALVSTCVAPSAALAVETSSGVSGAEVRGTLKEIAAAVAAEPAAAIAVSVPGLEAPAVGSDRLALGGSIGMALPAKGAGETVGNLTVYDATGPGQAQIAVQDVSVGTQALISIDGVNAPERYSFELSGDIQRLQANPDGSVAAWSADGELVGGAPAPWARDANGNAVPTYFEVNGTTLTQVILHRSADVAYGVTADPIWLYPALRACMAVRCYNWMPNLIRGQLLAGHMTSGVVYAVRQFFCARTWLC